MIRLKKITAVAAAIISAIVLLSACAGRGTQTVETDFFGNPFYGYMPDFLDEESGAEDYTVSSEIFAKTGSDTYRVSDDRITVNLTYTVPNEILWCFRHPALEIKNGDDWEMLPMSMDIYEAAAYETGWRGFGRTTWKSPEECMTVELDVEKSDLYDGTWKPGIYRAVVFLGNNYVVYAGFEIKA